MVTAQLPILWFQNLQNPKTKEKVSMTSDHHVQNGFLFIIYLCFLPRNPKIHFDMATSIGWFQIII